MKTFLHKSSNFGSVQLAKNSFPQIAQAKNLFSSADPDPLAAARRAHRRGRGRDADHLPLLLAVPLHPPLPHQHVRLPLRPPAFRNRARLEARPDANPKWQNGNPKCQMPIQMPNANPNVKCQCNSKCQMPFKMPMKSKMPNVKCQILIKCQMSMPSRTFSTVPTGQ